MECRLKGKLTAVPTIRVKLGTGETIKATLTVPSVIGTQPYTGDYVWTPAEQEQTIEINGLKATDNITIDPIPSNYGLITYNGSTITVS